MRFGFVVFGGVGVSGGGGGGVLSGICNGCCYEIVKICKNCEIIHHGCKNH